MIKRFFCSLFILLLTNIYICPETLARDLILESGTKVRLNLVNKVASDISQEGDRVDFTVAYDVKADDVVLIREGTPATGIISELYSRGRIGKPGQLNVTLESTKATDGRKIPLSGSIYRKGEDKLFLSVALSAFIFPLFLLMRGGNAQLPPGYQVLARVDNDVAINIDDGIVPVNNKK